MNSVSFAMYHARVCARHTTIFVPKSCAGLLAFFFCPGLFTGGGAWPVDGRHSTQYPTCTIATVGASPINVFTGSRTSERKLKIRIEASRTGWRFAARKEGWFWRISVGFVTGSGDAAGLVAGIGCMPGVAVLILRGVAVVLLMAWVH